MRTDELLAATDCEAEATMDDGTEITASCLLELARKIAAHNAGDLWDAMNPTQQGAETSTVVDELDTQLQASA